MATVNIKTSVLAIMQESTEGTAVVPSAATDYTAMQDDFTMAPAFDVLENAELRSSLGMGKPILGAENPSISFSHYLRHSGVEGQAPDYNLLLKAAWGNEDPESTEYDTVNGSSTTVLKVNTGEGAAWRRGQAALIKDGTNGYAIRPIHSISSDDLTMGFQLTTAPASGVNLGKAVTYYPSDTTHPTLTFWNYIGNGGALQAMTGGRTTETSISFEAGQLINASYTVEGIAFYLNPINITSSNNKMDFSDGSSREVSVAAKLYKTPHELASALQTAMNSVSSGITVTYSDTTGKYTIVKASGTLTLKWQTGANTAQTIGVPLGFVVSSDDSGVLTYTSDNAIDIDSPYTPTLDSSDPLAAKDNLVFIGDYDDNVCFAPSSVNFTLSTPKTDVMSVCEVSGKAGSIITSRTASVEVVALLSQYDVDKFERYRNATDTRFLYNFGVKSGGNWVAGKSGCLYIPTATVTNFEITNSDGLATLNITLQAYVDSSGNGEVYLSFV